MTKFEVLVIAHFVADWLFQNKRQAYSKLHCWKIRLEHCLIYGFITAWLYSFMLINDWSNTPSLRFIPLFLYLTIIHFIFDTPQVKLWWCKNIKREDNPPEWLLIGIDQIFHLVSLVPVVLINW